MKPYKILYYATGAGFAATLAMIGFSTLTWQFWVLMSMFGLGAEIRAWPLRD